jgi:high affinity Mn2+ porin
MLCLGVWPVFAQGGDAAQAQAEDRMARFQSTYIWQDKAAFPAAYSGPNSLANAKELAYTFTLTGFFGMRSWAGGEVYFLPELTQGVPMSNLTGMGGFTNGELTRASGSNPKLYRQKLFVRQTWNRGGGSSSVAAEVDQMAGSVDRDRFVLTAGNFSTLDVFDDNAYAKDPRTHFLNWGNMSYAAYDYAADARGFGWGVAGEWYQGDWVLRAARMTGPIHPNDKPVDFDLLHHYGDQIELEHAHALAGQPGKLRVLAWRNRAILAGYKEALAWGQAHPGSDPQWISQVRSGEKIKYGLGFNLEQAVSDSVGVFARVMRADGRSETYAFTEADASLSVGAAVKGKAWGRAQDTLGVAVLRNGLSPERRKYLEAGGISFFIGDGGLQYKPEAIVEAYYSLNVTAKTWVSFNYQHIQNPAYNAARGPVHVAGVRLHAEF